VRGIHDCRAHLSRFSQELIFLDIQANENTYLAKFRLKDSCAVLRCYVGCGERCGRSLPVLADEPALPDDWARIA
jgi:hypothetical protein